MTLTNDFKIIYAVFKGACVPLVQWPYEMVTAVVSWYFGIFVGIYNIIASIFGGIYTVFKSAVLWGFNILKKFSSFLRNWRNVLSDNGKNGLSFVGDGYDWIMAVPGKIYRRVTG